MPKFCPHVMDECLQDKCMHWMAFPMRHVTEPLNAPGTMEYDCAFNWAPRFMANTFGGVVGIQSAVENMRNETVKRQDVALALAAQNGKLLSADD